MDCWGAQIKVHPGFRRLPVQGLDLRELRPNVSLFPAMRLMTSFSRASRLVLLLGLAISWPAAGQRQQSTANYEMNRLTLEETEALVEAPMRLLRAGQIEQAERLFNQMIATTRTRRGANSVEEADLLVSFAGLMHLEGEMAEDARLRSLAATYAARAVEAYRGAFGPDHPEVAVALNSHSDILRIAHPDDPPAAAERLMDEAYRIRLAALGANHPETLWTMIYLAQIRGAPARVRENPALVAEMAALLERAAELTRTSDADSAPRAADIHARRARLLARNGRAEEARQALATAREAASADDPVEACLLLAAAARDVDDLLAGRQVSESVFRIDNWSRCAKSEP